MSTRMDLHCHSTYSDGTFEPAALLRMASRAKLRLLALADHDTMDGVQEAAAASAGTGVLVLPAVELDTESPFELHILGLDVAADSPALTEGLLTLKHNRRRRNSVILDKLAAAGFDVRPYIEESKGSTTRLHIAHALVAAGLARDATDAFVRYLNRGAAGYYYEQRFTPGEAIALIREAGGIPVLAHPCHIRSNVHALVRELVGLGLMGIEAYYPASTVRQTELFVSLAAQHGLLATCGSDFHGRNREGNPLGCAWRDTACLEETAQRLLARHGLSA